MKIPIPCNFGDFSDCKGRLLRLIGVSWFRWSHGMEYTYFFAVNDYWHDTSFYTTYKSEQPYYFEIPNDLLIDRYIKDHGYPLKGSGYACGVNYRDGKMYIDFLMTSNYFAHINVQCDNKGIYVPGGDIIFPKSWDTEEKKDSAVLKGYKTVKNTETELCVQEVKQISIFDFME